MIILSPADILQFRAQLNSLPEALSALEEIEVCEGDIEDAAISLALRAGQEPNTTEQWLADFSKRYRHFVCQDPFKDELSEGALKNLVSHLIQETDCPNLMAAPVAIYVVKTGVADFCRSFDQSRV